MDEEESSYYTLGGLTEGERAEVKERLEPEISDLTVDELTERIRGGQVELDVVYRELGATARVVVRILDELIAGVRNVAASLSAIDAPWAQVHARELLEAVQKAQISRHPREGKILRSLPKGGDEAVLVEWLRGVRLGENPDWLVAACKYGMARIHALRTVAAKVATALANDGPEAKACATRLREVAPE
jgi:hypothetical protein